MIGKESSSQQPELPEWTRQVDPNVLQQCLASGLEPLDVPGGWAREVPLGERTMTVPEIVNYHREKAEEAGLDTPLGLLHDMFASRIESLFKEFDKLR